MITKAIIEQKIDEFQYRVRIPIFDRTSDSTYFTDIDELAIAVASAPKGITNSLEVNDVVFVGFEDNNIATPVILGQLYNEKLLKQHNLHIQARSIDIEESVNLPIGTTLNADINLYDYIVKLKEQVDALELQIKQLAAR